MLFRFLVHFLRKESRIMATLADIQAKVDANALAVAQVIDGVNKLTAEVAALKADAADPAVLQAVSDKLDATNAALAAVPPVA